MDVKNKSAGTDLSRGSDPEVLEYERMKVRRKSNPSGVREIQRLSRMMAIVVILYYISWLPILVSKLVKMRQQCFTREVNLYRVSLRFDGQRYTIEPKERGYEI